MADYHKNQSVQILLHHSLLQQSSIQVSTVKDSTPNLMTSQGTTTAFI